MVVKIEKQNGQVNGNGKEKKEEKALKTRTR